jgi:hypothetical protein
VSPAPSASAAASAAPRRGGDVGGGLGGGVGLDDHDELWTASALGDVVAVEDAGERAGGEELVLGQGVARATLRNGGGEPRLDLGVEASIQAQAGEGVEPAHDAPHAVGVGPTTNPRRPLLAFEPCRAVVVAQPTCLLLQPPAELRGGGGGCHAHQLVGPRQELVALLALEPFSHLRDYVDMAGRHRAIVERRGERRCRPERCRPFECSRGLALRAARCPSDGLLWERGNPGEACHEIRLGRCQPRAHPGDGADGAFELRAVGRGGGAHAGHFPHQPTHRRDVHTNNRTQGV